MATLGNLGPDIAPAPGQIVRLTTGVDAYSRSQGSGLATQVAAGRHAQLLDGTDSKRLRVRLLEDGYPCWLERRDWQVHGQPAERPTPAALHHDKIRLRLNQVLDFCEQARCLPNRYLWGGSLGPNFDCSGLIQTAFASAGIWLPRDAYLQERFCQPVAVKPGTYYLLEPGDLIFFGTAQRCTHVGLHLGGGRYVHSSGQEHGRNGIGIDNLHPQNPDPVASHYRGELRGAGRVMHSHDGSPLPP
jgi:NlpC/P60 family/Bacterial dipeptidyl-peptidase Sh3 domain